MLAAADCGVDSCWVNCFDPDKLHEALGLPEHEEILMILDLGYAAPGAGPLPNHFSRKRWIKPSAISERCIFKSMFTFNFMKSL